MEQGGAGRWSDAELHGALARVFGYTAFRPHQIEIVKGILGGHDSLSIMPTGGRFLWRFPGLSSGSPNARWRRSRLRLRPRWSATSFPGSACGSPG